MKPGINKIAPALLACMVIIWGCDSQLDIDPEQSVGEDVALSTSENVQATLIGAYDRMSGGAVDAAGDVDNDGLVFGGYNLFEPDLLADDGEVRWVGSFEEPEQIWRKRIQVENVDVEDQWELMYETINIVNNVLSALDVVSAGARDRVEGEALFIRGTMYFELLKLYAQPWSAGNQSSNPGVPLVTEPTRSIDESSQIGRSTVDEGYTLVLNDLTRAESLLPQTNGTFATSLVAAAMLSRVYLQQGDYTNARDAANRVISSNQFALVPSYADAFAQDNNTTEDIFATQISAQDGFSAMNNFYAPVEFSGRADINIQQAHLDLYEDGDERADLFFADETGILRTGKWINQFGNINIIRLAEMYLTRAEANLELGTVIGDTPANDVNRIRNRAGLGDLLVVDKDDILRERKLELAFEGQLLHDLKRTQRPIGAIPFNASELVYPIPQRELDVNPNLEQNDGY